MNTYINPEDRKTILFIGDDIRHYSGIGVISKSIIYRTANHFNWIQWGFLTRRPDDENSKIVDISKSIENETGFKDINVKIYQDSITNNMYGDIRTLRKILSSYHIDAILFFTDPRYYTWLFNAEREIRHTIPLIYLNIWDNLPYPLWNEPFYKSCDGLFAISKQTYNINIQLTKGCDNQVIKYIPHGVNSAYHPLSDHDPELIKYKNSIWGENKPEFVLLYNARNIIRKRTSDIILSWREFCNRIGPTEASRCELVLHTDAIDPYGTDLITVYNDLCDKDYVKVRILTNKYDFPTMNLMYNASDGVIMASSNEGWGLALTEALNTGKMFIAPVCGGMQDQMRFEDEKGNWLDFSLHYPTNKPLQFTHHGEWCIPVKVESTGISGSPKTPYIFDDYIRNSDLTDAIEKLYKMPPDMRKKHGMVGYEWAISEEAGFTEDAMVKRVIDGIEEVFSKFKPRTRFDVTKVEESDIKKINQGNSWII